MENALPKYHDGACASLGREGGRERGGGEKNFGRTVWEISHGDIFRFQKHVLDYDGIGSGWFA